LLSDLILCADCCSYSLTNTNCLLIFYHSLSLRKTNTNTTSAPFVLCRQVPGREGYGLPEYDPEYELATPVFSAMKLSDIQKGSENDKKVEVAKNSLDALSSGFSAATEFKKGLKLLASANIALAAVSGALSVAGFFVSS
jgi:hypothetical protein